jgi:hypothetical protein
VKTVIEPKKQILCHEIEPNPSKDRAMHEGDNPSFLDEFIKFVFFLTELFIHKSRKKQILCHEIEPNPSKDRTMYEGDNPSFSDEFIKFTFFLTEIFIYYHHNILVNSYFLKAD